MLDLNKLPDRFIVDNVLFITLSKAYDILNENELFLAKQS